MIEVIYEDSVFKPLHPIEGVDRNEKTWIILCPRKKEGLDGLIGTLTPEEAEKMQNTIDREFTEIEGE
ncbi:antitoxin AF2212-like protein [Desulfonema magnum]|uniref:DUF1954 n=1 Tax=Desulfonema magnum TaxID=45655 RepID=A0A975GKH5_9BACT|nr:antitoxin AF2212-like protein [Desulfonema magnum]QTA84716.1 DUF1954 [Desulfonema magnum]